MLNEPCRSLALIRRPLPWPLNQVVRFVAITQDNRLFVTNCDFAEWEDQSGILPGTLVAAAFSLADGGPSRGAAQPH